jgi:hypothetical protein
MAAKPQPPVLVTFGDDGAGYIVNTAYEEWSTIAKQAFMLAEQLAQQITNVPVSPVAFNANFDPQLALGAFPTIPAPASPGDLQLNAPALPPAPPTITIPKLPTIAYVDTLLSTMQGAVNALLAGAPLPAAVASELRNRAYAEANAEEARAVSAAYDEFAARGFSEPTGLLNSRVVEARTAALKMRNATNRDVYIQDQMTAIESVKIGVTSGIRLEEVEVEVFRSTVQMELQESEVAIEQSKLELTAWQSSVELYDTELKGAIAQLDATLNVFKANVQVYEANAQVATAAGEYDNRRFQLNLSQEQAIVSTEMKRQDQQFEQMRYITSVMVEVKKAISSVSAQLAAAAMSAVNIGASVNHSSSNSMGYSMSLGYSGALADTSDGGVP